MRLADEQATRRAGLDLASVVRAGDVVTLAGPLGAGKTTFVRGLLHGLGHQGDVPSPSFALVQPYDDLHPPVWHCDLFRLTDPGELEELGLDSIADWGVLVVEWPERAGNRAFPHALRLTMAIEPDGARRLTAEVPAAWKGRCPFP